MAWICYFTGLMKAGHACPEIVTGKPIELLALRGPTEATGRG
ncbi:MAG: hypothetical protein U0798_19240 [Gemmataceae bacterium]